ncbi:MAG TPA: TetR/AcrR family transcriptional regulator [Galbitalea sp.]|jgi:AcrR family transcriptional regulator|nr:TetR/AcrR family transcriptional regulator [Galbitalea sp.]
MQTSEPGLRERKRAETRDRLETAAVTLVLKNGLEHATLDAICEAADVSTRTFFNYFDSKEDAILGLKDSAITDESMAALIASHAGADPVELTVRLMFGVLSPSISSSTLFTSRMKIVKLHPQLLGRMANQMQRMTEQLTNAIRPILRSAPEFVNEDVTETDLSVEVMLSLCSGATRAAVKEWATKGNQAPLAAVEQRAIELVRNTVKRIK